MKNVYYRMYAIEGNAIARLIWNEKMGNANLNAKKMKLKLYLDALQVRLSIVVLKKILL